MSINDRAEFQAWVAASCAVSGAPLAIEDPAALADIRELFGLSVR